jgi:hypothetical protein
MGFVTIIVVLIVLLIVAGSFFLTWWLGKKRSEAMGAFARQLGWSYSMKPSQTEISALSRPENLSSMGDSQSYENLLKGSYSGYSWAVYDFSFTESMSRKLGDPDERSENTTELTIIQAAAKKQLPYFILTPQTFLHFFANILGNKDIDFAGNPVFSKRFVLRGSSEQEIRLLFSPEVLRYIETMDSLLCIISDKGSLTIYKQGVQIDPPELRKIIDSTAMLLQKMGA